MNNKKRAIMVPVMTLAVCAIAMVGLGFALTTSVTSSTNDIHSLAIDLERDANDLGSTVTGPNTQSVNNLFDLEIWTEKVTNDNGTTEITYKLKSETAYFQIFENTTEAVTLKISSNTAKLNSMTFVIDNEDSNPVTLNAETGTAILANTVHTITVTSCTFEIDGAIITASTSGTVVTSGDTLPISSIPKSYALTFTAEETVIDKNPVQRN